MIDNNIDINEEIIIDVPPIPKKEDYIISYIDILGAKELISDYHFYETIYNSFMAASKVFSKLKLFKDIEVKIFSDNIIIFIKVYNNDNDSIKEGYLKMVSFLKVFLSGFIVEGILFRGAISFNKLAINSIMVWGEGLVEVVELEENAAIYPRIIVSESILSILRKTNYNLDEFEEMFSCLIDNDGYIYLDYLDYGEYLFAKKALLKSYNIIKTKLKNEKKYRLIQKYKWHLHYLEKARNIFNDYYGKFDYIEWENVNTINQ